MSKRYGLLASLILLFTLTAISSAANVTWNNNASDGNWTNASNWIGGVVPNTTSDWARINMATGPVFSAGQTATVFRVYLEGTNGTITMNGGTLNTNSHVYVAIVSTDTATLNMNSGAINIATTLYIARDAGSVGNVNLSGGTITCNSLIMNLNDQVNGLGRMNITGTGTLIINGDATSTIATCVTNGWIKAYNGTGTVLRDYNITTPGKTTVWASGTIGATNPNPANSATNISTSTTLSWTAGVSAASHNVYFGTANPPAYIGNQTNTTYSPGTLAINKTYYWRIDEVEDANHINTGTVWSFSTQGSFQKGPYLIYPGNNAQMTVLWQMSNTIGCTLAWGLDPNCTTGSTATTEYGTDHQHKYTITGLTPGTKYYYKITAGSAQTTSSFRTAPAANATSVKFFAYGDTRTFPADHSTVCAGMNSVIAGDPDFQTMLLHTGDWSEFDTETSWTNEYFNRSYAPILQMQSTLPIQGTIGNHESGASCFTKYWPYTYAAGTGKYWSFDYGPAHIAVIDQYSANYSDPNQAQLTWLKNDLSASTKKWKFIVLHQPGWSDSLNNVNGGHDNDTDVQNHIQPLCVQYGVQIVFCGHNHYYSRAVVNGVHHITSGGGGAPLYTLASGPNIVVAVKSFDFCKISIDGNSLTCQAVQPDGTVLDTFYIDKQQPEFTFAQVTDVQIGMCDGDAG